LPWVQGRICDNQGLFCDTIWSTLPGVSSQANQRLTELEGRREDVLNRVRMSTGSLGVDNLFVWVHWHDGAPARGRSNSTLAEQLLEIVRDHLPRQGETVKLGTEVDFDQEFSDPTFERIKIDRSQPHGGVFFATMYSDWLGDLSADYLRGRISAKTGKRRPSLPSMVEHWLVIYGAHGPLSSYMEPEPSALTETYQSVFDRIFLTFPE
jgi:hypothetical protein